MIYFTIIFYILLIHRNADLSAISSYHISGLWLRTRASKSSWKIVDVLCFWLNCSIYLLINCSTVKRWTFKFGLLNCWLFNLLKCTCMLLLVKCYVLWYLVCIPRSQQFQRNWRKEEIFLVLLVCLWSAFIMHINCCIHG